VLVGSHAEARLEDGANGAPALAQVRLRFIDHLSACGRRVPPAGEIK
jgi:hypothetical protein